MHFTFYIDNATYPLCWELPLNILWLFSMIFTLVRTMVNNLQSRFDQGWYILVFRIPAQCENCLRIMVHSNDHPTLTSTYYFWIGWMSPIWYIVSHHALIYICKFFSFADYQPFEDGLDHLLYAPHCSFQSRCNQI
jgi:hypothetical protein